MDSKYVDVLRPVYQCGYTGQWTHHRQADRQKDKWTGLTSDKQDESTPHPTPQLHYQCAPVRYAVITDNHRWGEKLVLPAEILLDPFRLSMIWHSSWTAPSTLLHSFSARTAISWNKNVFYCTHKLTVTITTNYYFIIPPTPTPHCIWSIEQPLHNIHSLIVIQIMLK